MKKEFRRTKTTIQSKKKITFEVIHRSNPGKKERIKASLEGYHTIHNYISEMKLAGGFIWVKPLSM